MVIWSLCFSFCSELNHLRQVQLWLYSILALGAEHLLLFLREPLLDAVLMEDVTAAVYFYNLVGVLVFRLTDFKVI